MQVKRMTSAMSCKAGPSSSSSCNNEHSHLPVVLVATMSTHTCHYSDRVSFSSVVRERNRKVARKAHHTINLCPEVTFKRTHTRHTYSCKKKRCYTLVRMGVPTQIHPLFNFSTPTPILILNVLCANRCCRAQVSLLFTNVVIK